MIFEDEILLIRVLRLEKQYNIIIEQKSLQRKNTWRQIQRG